MQWVGLWAWPGQAAVGVGVGPYTRDTVDSNRPSSGHVSAQACPRSSSENSNQPPGRRCEGRTPESRTGSPCPRAGKREPRSSCVERPQLPRLREGCLASPQAPGTCPSLGAAGLRGHQGPSCCYQRLTWPKARHPARFQASLGLPCLRLWGHVAPGAQRPIGFLWGHRPSPHGSRSAAPGTSQP